MASHQESLKTPDNPAKMPSKRGGAPTPLPIDQSSITATKKAQPRLIHPSHRPADLCPRDAADWTEREVAARSHPLFDVPVLDDLQFIHAKITAKRGSEHLGCWAVYDRCFDYGKTAAVLANSSFRDRRDVAMCGKRGRHGWFGCGNRLFCPRCLHNRRTRRLLAAFASTDLEGYQVQAWYLVLSVSTNPDEAQRFIMKNYEAQEHKNKPLHLHTANHMPFSTTSEVFACRMMVEFFQEAIRELTRAGILHGAVGGPEISLKLMPLRVMPHANYVIYVPAMTEKILRQIRDYVRKKMRGCRNTDWSQALRGFYPDVAAYHLASGEDRSRVLQYVTKAINIGAPYDDVRAACQTEPSAMLQINAQVNQFLTNVVLFYHSLPRITRWGACHGQSKSSVAAGGNQEVSVWESLRKRRRKTIKPAGPGLTFATFTQWTAKLARRRPWSRFVHWNSRQSSTPDPARQPPGGGC